MSRLWLAFVPCLAFIAVACGGGSSAGPATPAGTAVTTGPAASGPSSAPATLYGVSLSPRSFQGDGFTSFFDDAKQVGEVVGWYGDWAQLGDKSASPAAVAQLASRYGYTPLFIANLYDEQTGVLRPLDAANLQAYKDAAAAFARQYKPAYLGFGIEVNVLWERWPDDFEKFVNLFSETYDIVKAASPQTRVFTVFQLERMKGLQGGLFGGKNDATQAEWQLVQRFAKADLIAFTTYPGIVFADPNDIPDAYYAELPQRTAKPIAFSEIGWPSSLGAAGWQSSEEEQARFVTRFFELTRTLEPRIAIWSFLYDQSLADPFRGIGLLRPDGTKRPAWQAWNDAR